MSNRIGLLLSAALLAFAAPSTTVAEPDQSYVIILDASHSMNQSRSGDGVLFRDLAHAATRSLVDGLGRQGRAVGMVQFGANPTRLGDCANHREVVPVRPVTGAHRENFDAFIDAISLDGGRSPLANSMVDAFAALPPTGGEIVIVSDFERDSNCARDPCQVGLSLIRRGQATDKPVRFRHIVVPGAASAELRDLAACLDSEVIEISSLADLPRTLLEVLPPDEPAEAAPAAAERVIIEEPDADEEDRAADASEGDVLAAAAPAPSIDDTPPAADDNASPPTTGALSVDVRLTDPTLFFLESADAVSVVTVRDAQGREVARGDQIFAPGLAPGIYEVIGVAGDLRFPLEADAQVGAGSETRVVFQFSPPTLAIVARVSGAPADDAVWTVEQLSTGLAEGPLYGANLFQSVPPGDYRISVTVAGQTRSVIATSLNWNAPYNNFIDF